MFLGVDYTFAVGSEGAISTTFTTGASSEMHPRKYLGESTKLKVSSFEISPSDRVCECSAT